MQSSGIAPDDYLFYYGETKVPAAECAGASCTVKLAKTQTPLDASSWQHITTLDWHRNG